MDSLILFWAVTFNLIITIALFFTYRIQNNHPEIKPLAISFFIAEIRYFLILSNHNGNFEIENFVFLLSEILQNLSGIYVIEAYLKNSNILISLYKKIILFFLLCAVTLFLLIFSKNTMFASIPSTLCLAMGYLLFAISILKTPKYTRGLSILIGILAIILCLHRLDFPYFFFNPHLRSIGILINCSLLLAFGISIIIGSFIQQHHELESTFKSLLSTRIALKENAKKLEVINNFLTAIIYSFDF